jgi:5-methylcytosine-specific restriction endonuclease McrA
MGSGYEFDREKFFLGKSCKHGHNYEGSGFALRYLSRSRDCVECARARSRRQAADGNHSARVKACYLRNGRASRSKRNPSPEKVPYGSLGLQRRLAAESRRAAQAEIRDQRQAERERRRAERQTPEHKEEQRMKRLIRYALDENLRLYNREKSKRRKATMKERHAVRVRARDIRARFAQFDGCAYCGAHGDMHMDHFIPLAGGGTHALGNLVPACPSCNYSKTDHDPEQWYRAQPFFTEKRWRNILQVLGVKRGSPLQLALL